jgi:UDP:flavonoid glycosyltransferase YjiC (YdhE family)
VPALSVPLTGQFEQVLNARYLERLGFGMYAPHPSDAAIAAFAERLPDCRAALREAERPGNGQALAAIDEQLAAAVA